MPLSDFLGLEYKLEKSEKFDEFLKALGVGMVMRKMANSASPVVKLTESGGEYTLSSASLMKTTITKFRLGEQFDEETADGRKVKSTITLEGDNRLVHVMDADKVSKVVRDFAKDQVVMTLTVDDIVCTRIYKAQ